MIRIAKLNVANRLHPKRWTRQAPPGLLAREVLAPARGLPFARLRPAKAYGRIGDLEVRLASGRGDVKRAQRLRYSVFFEEMAAKATVLAAMRRRDEDPYDALCDHLLVVDTAIRRDPKAWGGKRKADVVGTYRVLRQEVARLNQGFYTQGEYDIAPLVARKGDLSFLEVGRSCVLKPYRTKRTVELLWHGLWTYIREVKADVLIGCASFAGTDPRSHAMALSFLHHNALAPEEWLCRAHDRLRVDMNMVPREALDMKAALKAMPPLIKAYLRLGAWVGDGAVVDKQFGTTDVLIVLPVARIDPRYFEHFGAPGEVKSRVALDG